MDVRRTAYAYTAQSEDELTVEEGVLVKIQDASDADWWAVRVLSLQGGDTAAGLIPSSYLEEVEAVSMATAAYAYEATNDEELTMEEGESLDVLDATDSDWILVRLSGKTSCGYVPASYLETNEEKAVEEAVIEEKEEVSEVVKPRTTVTSLAVAVPLSNGSAGSATLKKPVVSPDLEYFSVSEVDKKKKKRKGRLGVGGPTVFWASETDKAPVRQYSITDMTRCVTRSEHLYMDFAGKDPVAYDFHCGKKKIAENILSKLKKAWEETTHENADGTLKSDVEEEKGVKLDAKEKTLKEVKRVTVEDDVDERPPPATPKKEALRTKFKITIVYDFDAAAEDELSVKEGDVLEVVDDSDPEWFTCRYPGSTTVGVVPATYCQVGEVSTVVEQTPPPPPEMSFKYAVATFDFPAENEDEIPLREGDPVLILDDASSSEWWRIRVVEADGTEREGLAPSAYLEVTDAETAMQRQAEAEQRRAEEESAKTQVRKMSLEKEKKAAMEATSASLSGKVKLPALPPRSAASRAPGPAVAPKPSSAKSSVVSKADEPLTKPSSKRVRTWVDRSGRHKTEAEFIKLEDGKVHLHKTNGVIIAVPLDQMSAGDAAYIDSLDTSREEHRRVSTPTTKEPYNPYFDWIDFLLKVGIDTDDAIRYSKTFTAERLDDSSVAHFNAAQLKSLGVVPEDISRILAAASTFHSSRTETLRNRLKEEDEAKNMRRSAMTKEQQMREDAELARRLQREEDEQAAKILAKNPKLTMDKLYGGANKRISKPSRVESTSLREAQQKLLTDTSSSTPEGTSWSFEPIKEKPKPITEMDLPAPLRPSSSRQNVTDKKDDVSPFMADMELLSNWANTPVKESTSAKAATAKENNLEWVTKDVESSLQAPLEPQRAGFGAFIPTYRKPPPPPQFASAAVEPQQLALPPPSGWVPNQRAPPPIPVSAPSFQQSEPSNALVLRKPDPAPVFDAPYAALSALVPSRPTTIPSYASRVPVNPTSSLFANSMDALARRPPPPVPSSTTAVNPYRPFDNVQRRPAPPPPSVTPRIAFAPMPPTSQTAFGLQQSLRPSFQSTSMPVYQQQQAQVVASPFMVQSRPPPVPPPRMTTTTTSFLPSLPMYQSGNTMVNNATSNMMSQDKYTVFRTVNPSAPSVFTTVQQAYSQPNVTTTTTYFVRPPPPPPPRW